MTYVVCVNQPGYLPETEPERYDDLTDAVLAVGEQICLSHDNADQDRPESPATMAYAACVGAGGAIYLPDGYVVEVSQTDD